MGVSQEEVNEWVKKLELDGSKPSSKIPTQAFINGKFCDAISGKTLETTNPFTGQVVANIASCDKEDVDLAVTAARNAFESGSWSKMAPEDRKQVLLKFAALIEENLVELSVIESIDGGKPVTECIEGDITETFECIRYHAEAIDKLFDQVVPTGPGNLGLIVREPVGVCGLITPWNFPLLMVAWKIGPALAVGNSVVIKPAELTSLSALRMAVLAKEAGIPDGVLNIVPGLGTTAGAAVSNHMDIDMVGFTGSSLVGRLVLKAASESNLKRVSLELGGKSPQLLFDDADLEKAIPHVAAAAFWNSSQNCSCGSRLLVQNSIKSKVLDLLKSHLDEEWPLGDPILVTTKLGPMVSTQHAKKVNGYIEKGKSEASLVKGGKSTVNGMLIEPTIFETTNESSIAREEVFGPLLSVIPFETEQDAIRIANDTDYGLAASLYSNNIHRCTRVSRALKAGNVSVNCFAEGSFATPFGGYKQSGFVGRDKSVFAHEQYCEMKTIWMEIQE